MADELRVELAGERLRLQADRALYWPRASTLVIADLHLGKADHFRRAGIALPRGGTSHDLARLDALLLRTGAARLLVLGDMVHGALPDAPWRARWSAWRQERPALRVEVVAGNHDRRLRGDPALAAALGLVLHETALHAPPFVFVHAPGEAAASASAYVLAGHLHPVLRLPGLPRLPAFRFGAQGGVLPAFTRFSGGQAFVPEAGERAFVCAPGALAAVPAP